MVKTFVLVSRNNYQEIDMSKLLYCLGQGNYTTLFFTDQKKIILTKLIKDVEKNLENKDFLRVNNNSLVNINYIKSYSLGKEPKVVLLNDIEFSISRRRKEKIKKILNLQFSHIK